jgi:uncharacterized repeat protein (TIGR03803 family)
MTPEAALIEARDGSFYGTTTVGGAFDLGTVYRIDRSGELFTLHSFSGRDGRNPRAALVQASDGSLYGTTAEGGPRGGGVVFRVGPIDRPLAVFRRGDCNDDGIVDISDAVCVLNWLFLDGNRPGCIAATNTNGDAVVNITDASYLLNSLFLGGPAPVAPFPGCGPGTLPADDETCETRPKNCP